MPTTDDITRFEALDEVLVSGKTMRIENVRYHKQFVILKFEGIADMNAAILLKGMEIKIPEALALPLADNEFYIRDLYDMEVFTDDGELLGVITDIIFTGANDVYVIKNEERELLIPAIKSCVLDVDVKADRMTVRLLEGMDK